MAFFRWFVGLPMAAIITAGLFAMMAGLISSESVIVDEYAESPRVDILAKIEESDPTPAKPPKVIPADPPPVIDTQPTDWVTEPGPPIDTTPISDLDNDTDGFGVTFAKPVIKFPPQYPENCRSRAAEGTVIVQFDITPEGNVVNIRILESANSCFNRTVRSTVAKWKYPPTTRNGRAVKRYDIVEVIRFELDG